MNTQTLVNEAFQNQKDRGGYLGWSGSVEVAGVLIWACVSHNKVSFSHCRVGDEVGVELSRGKADRLLAKMVRV